jgi:hypothetical protein
VRQPQPGQDEHQLDRPQVRRRVEVPGGVGLLDLPDARAAQPIGVDQPDPAAAPAGTRLVIFLGPPLVARRAVRRLGQHAPAQASAALPGTRADLAHSQLGGSDRGPPPRRAEILRRAGLLDAACGRMAGPRGVRHRVGAGPRSCQTCGAWGTRRRCQTCQQWEASGYQPGTCQRCGQPDVPLRGGRCRACLIHIREHGTAAVGQSWIQLWFALPAAGGPGGPVPWTRAGDPQQSAPAVSAHRIDPAQLVLFSMRRDWWPALGSAELPPLTDAAQRLLDDFSRAQPAPGSEAVRKSAQALRILVAWLGADAPFHEADVRALASPRAGVQTRRVLTFLAARDMLIPDPGRQSEPRQHAVHRLLESLPGRIGRETAVWVSVVRGQGRVEHPPLTYKTIRNYLAYLLPVLTGWASRYVSLREVTRADILDAVDARHGPVIQHRVVALRSLFRALRQERVIFRDPTRGISLPASARLPQPLPADHVAGLLDRADGPAARLAVALVAIHAVTEADLARFQTADLDLASGTLAIRRGHRRRTVYLDEVTAALASQWLRHRHQRWPASRNPHLMVSQQTAADTGPVGTNTLWNMFQPLGVRPDRLRQDRILDEARHTADPVHRLRHQREHRHLLRPRRPPRPPGGHPQVAPAGSPAESEPGACRHRS